MSRTPGRRSVHVSDFALGISVAGLLVAQVATGSVSGSVAVVAVGGPLLGACMLLRRPYPWSCLLATFAVIVGIAVLGVGEEGNYAIILAGFVSLYTLASLVSVRQTVAGFAVALVAGFLSALPGSGATKSSFVGFVLLGAVLSGRSVGNYRMLGQRLQSSVDELEAGREELIAARIAEEKVKIARELHDVIAHAVSVMVIQASAAEALLDVDAVKSREPLIAVQESGRQALGELRRLLDVLRPNMRTSMPLVPQPGLSDLPVVVQGLREAGIEVSVEVFGELECLPPGVDLAAFRVIQEALTNVLKHSSASSATVEIHRDSDAIDLVIRDNGNGESETFPRTIGHGLVGMRERVVAYGGRLVTGSGPLGGYQVAAHLKIPNER